MGEPKAFISSIAIRCAGILRAIVGKKADTSGGTNSFRGSISVRGPGKNDSINSKAILGTS